jgi:hypothetical protein
MGYTDLHTRTVRTKHHIRGVTRTRTFSELDMTARSATSQNPKSRNEDAACPYLSYVDVDVSCSAMMHAFVFVFLSEIDYNG